MAGENKTMPDIYNASGEKMNPEDLKTGDILVVYWAESAKCGAGTSIICFEKFGESGWDRKGVVFFRRAEFEPSGVCCYPLEVISEMRFCAHDSSASSQIFSKLCGLYRENKRVTEKLGTIKERFLKFVE